DGAASLVVDGEASQEWAPRSVFASREEASAFFERGAVGYSARRRPGSYDGMELRSFRWEVSPLRVTRARSSFFEDPAMFPSGSVTLDDALLMQGVEHEWIGRRTLTAPETAERSGADDASSAVVRGGAARVLR
ncbi:MAG TPA: hypothetical protein VEI02_02105, partial [Planctomycetota bacterium]|nr:hypothetical protein [Planctomycetota bacterium]